MNWFQNTCLFVSLGYQLGVMLPQMLAAQESNLEGGNPHREGQCPPTAAKSDLLNRAETKG